MSTLFLDFDGVLNSMRFRQRVPGGWNQLDANAVAQINWVVERTRCNVVVSSSWRLGDHGDEGAIKRLTRILRENGATFDVLDVTPAYAKAPQDCYFCAGNEEGGGWCRRGHQIQAWIDAHGGAASVGPFAIVDDDGDMGSLGERFVHTRDYFGIQPHHVAALIHLLTDNS